MIDLSIIGKEIERIYIANSDDKHILFYCADQSWYSLHYNHDHCQDPRYFLSSAGVVNLFEATVVSFVEDFAPTPLAGEIGSIGATITTNLGACIFSSVVSPYGCSIYLSLVSDIEEFDANSAVRNVPQSKTDKRDYQETEYWRLKLDF